MFFTNNRLFLFLFFCGFYFSLFVILEQMKWLHFMGSDFIIPQNSGFFRDEQLQGFCTPRFPCAQAGVGISILLILIIDPVIGSARRIAFQDLPIDSFIMGGLPRHFDKDVLKSVFVFLRKITNFSLDSVVPFVKFSMWI